MVCELYLDTAVIKTSLVTATKSVKYLGINSK